MPEMPTVKLNPTIYQNNLEALQKRYPDLALMLGMVQVEKYRLCQQEKCLPNVILPDGHFYYIGNMHQYCDEQLKGFDLDNVRVVVFCGFGLGYEAIYWMQTQSQKFGTQAIFIFEKDLEMFQCAMNVTDLTTIINNEHIHLHIGTPLNELYPVLRTHFQANLQELLLCGATQPVFMYPAVKIGKEYYIRAMQIFFEAIYHTIQNFGNCPEDSLIGLENMLDNIAQIVNNPGINMLYDKLKGHPAVIVATGPSLKKNMHLLKGIEEKALIISVDASFKLLMKNGIKPHMVTSLEREHEVQQFFDGFDSGEVKDVYMTACPVLFNHVYESYAGPQIIVYRNFDHFKWLEIDRGILEIALSSANMAFKVAEALGCNPIILVGQDLAYGENGETHATEVPFSSEGEAQVLVKGNYVDQIRTNSGWYNFLRALEVDISKFRGQVINCTEGGAFIPGTQIATFAETIDKYIQDEFHPLAIIKENLAQFTVDDVASDMTKLKALFEQTEKEVREIINLCISGCENHDRYKEELEIGTSSERINEIRQEIVGPRLEIQTKYHNTFQKFLMHIVQSTHLKFEMETVMTCKDAAQVLLQFNKWYAFVGDISELCLQSLERAKEKLYG